MCTRQLIGHQIKKGIYKSFRKAGTFNWHVRESRSYLITHHSRLRGRCVSLRGEGISGGEGLKGIESVDLGRPFSRRDGRDGLLEPYGTRTGSFSVF